MTMETTIRHRDLSNADWHRPTEAIAAMMRLPDGWAGEASRAPHESILVGAQLLCLIMEENENFHGTIVPILCLGGDLNLVFVGQMRHTVMVTFRGDDPMMVHGRLPDGRTTMTWDRHPDCDWDWMDSVQRWVCQMLAPRMETGQRGTTT